MSGHFDDKKCARWMERGLQWPGPRAVQIVLGMKDEGGRVTGVDNWPIPEDQQYMDIATMCMTIHDAAQDRAHAEGEGIHRFVVEMYHGDAAGRGTPWGATYAFYMVGAAADTEETPGGAGGALEAPTAKGFAAQQMRHNEQLHQRLLTQQDFMARYMMATVANVTHENQQLKIHYWDTVSAREALLDERNRRENENLDAQARRQKFNRLWEVLYTILPIVAAKVFGRPEIGIMMGQQVHGGGPMMAIMEQIVNGLTEEQIPALLAILNEEQTQAFIQLHEMFQEVKKKKLEAEEAAKHLATTSQDDVPARPSQVDPRAGFGNVFDNPATDPNRRMGGG